MPLTLHTPESISDDEFSDQVADTSKFDELLEDESQKETVEADSPDNQVAESPEQHDESPEQTTGPEPADHDDAFWQELEIIGRIAQAERECQELESTLSEIKDEQKEAKEKLSFAQLKLRAATADLVGHIGDRELPEQPAKPADSQSSGGNDSQNQQATDNDWQNTPTAELLSGTKGLGAKKLEAIVDIAPTAGKLEELRGEASKAHQSFKEVLPKGCGQSIADAIEDRLVELVAKASTPPASEQVEPRVEDADEADEANNEGDTEPSADAGDDEEEYEDVADL